MPVQVSTPRNQEQRKALNHVEVREEKEGREWKAEGAGGDRGPGAANEG